MSSSSQKTLFLVGPGLIGSTLLVRLLATRPDLKLHALTRREEQASQLRSLGVEPIVGSLTDHDLIADWSRKSDIIIHAASADDDAATFAIVDGIQARPAGSSKVIYIQTSGNDELVHSAKGLSDKSIADKTLSDTWTDEELEKRIQPDAYHRHVDGPLRERLFNKQAEKKYNAVTSIMMPPLIYGIGAEPFKRISIQTPMLTRAMMKHGQVFTLPQGHKAVWNAVSVHDLVEAYLILLKDLEGITPGDSDTRRSHYVFPAEPQPFQWKEHFDAVVSQLQENNHPSAKNDVKVLQSPQEFEEIIKPLAGPYTPCFVSLVWGSENSYTKPDYLSNLGFKHQAMGVLHSITNDKELDTVINHGA